MIFSLFKKVTIEELYEARKLQERASKIYSEQCQKPCPKDSPLEIVDWELAGAVARKNQSMAFSKYGDLMHKYKKQNKIY